MITLNMVLIKAHVSDLVDNLYYNSPCGTRGWWTVYYRCRIEIEYKVPIDDYF